ncbi:sensor histidine kinase [Croceivirga radicis]|uniref:sensor histidine kinase n=1 Tax=Croceivirga radicis TaxID=1929488 RepID=UPI000255AB4E|nr:histidine kinase [Croceivirga radicis]
MIRKWIKFIFPDSKPILGFNDRYFAMVASIINCHTAMTIYFTNAFFTIPKFLYFKKWLEFYLIVSVIFICTRKAYLFLVKKYPAFEQSRARWKRIPLVLLPFLGIAIPYVKIYRPKFSIYLENYGHPNFYNELVTGTIIILVDLAIYETIYLLLELKEAKIKEKEYQNKKLLFELSGLKNQISPHFLFNNLNSLLYLIDESPEKSKEFVHKLSFIYHKILEGSQKDLIAVSEEMEYTNAYIDLLQQRFAGNLVFNVDVKSKNMKVIPLALQICIENAVKHNIVSKNHPLTISITDKDGYLIITNNKQLKPKPFSSGIGINNIKDRYGIITDQSVIVQENQSSFTLKLPLIP